jgi:hypothetical protein
MLDLVCGGRRLTYRSACASASIANIRTSHTRWIKHPNVGSISRTADVDDDRKPVQFSPGAGRCATDTWYQAGWRDDFQSAAPNWISQLAAGSLPHLNGTTGPRRTFCSGTRTRAIGPSWWRALPWQSSAAHGASSSGQLTIKPSTARRSLAVHGGQQVVRLALALLPNAPPKALNRLNGKGGPPSASPFQAGPCSAHHDVRCARNIPKKTASARGWLGRGRLRARRLEPAHTVTSSQPVKLRNRQVP